MLMRAPRRLVALLALPCVLAGCQHSRERSASLSEIMKAGQSERGQRIRTTAIVTYSDPEWRVLFVQDQGVGMYLTIPPGFDVRAGDRVEVVGNIPAPGKELEKSSVRVISSDNPLPPAPRVNDYSALPQFFSQLVEVRGIVRWSGIRNGRPALQMSTGGNVMTVYFRQALTEDLPVMASEVRVAGVAAADFDSNGKFRGPKLFSPSTRQLKFVRAGPRDPFSVSLKSLGELKTVVTDSLVHVTGDVSAGEKGSTVGDVRMTLPVSFQESMPAVSGMSDIAGFWTGHGIEDATARPLSNHLAKNGDIVHLADLKHLSMAAASARRGVSVRAVVTYVDSAWGILFVQDKTAAAYVDAHKLDIRLQPGDLVDVSGVTGAGGYAPQVDEPKVGFVQKVRLPEPVRIDLLEEDLSTVDSGWCTFRGVVHTARERDGHTILEIGAGQSDLSIQLPMPIHSEQLIDREVSVTGVFGVLFNDRRQAIGHQIFVPSTQFLTVLDSPAKQTAPVAIASLQRYNPDIDERHSVTVSGTVVLRSDSNNIYIEDGTAGIQVRGEQPLEASDGDRVSVRGFVSVGEYSPLLEHSVVTSRSTGVVPKPELISAKTALEGHYDSEYVAMRATLSEVRASSDGAILVLNDEGSFFDAVGPASSKLSSLRPGSQVEVRGVCRVSVEKTRFSIDGFTLAFDSPESVSVIRLGPWWDTRKITRALFTIVLIAALASLWIALLRQKVQTKTSELQASIEAKRRAQQFDAARNQVLEAIARNAPPPESMEMLALAVQAQIAGSICAIALAPEGKSFLNGKPSAVLIAPDFPEVLQREMLPVLSAELAPSALGTSALASEIDDAYGENLRSDTDVQADLLKVANDSGLNFCDGQATIIFSGTGEVAGLLILFFREVLPDDADNAARVLQSASRLVSLARDHWQMHQQLVFDARHDPLTGLPNRTLAEDRLEQALARAQRRKQFFAVLCIDLDGFKGINDNLGHHAGDELLRVVASRLRARIRHSDTLARIGGDEFLAVIEDCSGDSAVQSVADSLLAALREPVTLDGKKATVSGSIGIAMYPTDGKNPTELKRNADQAMYRAKAQHGGQICFWSGDCDQASRPLRKSSYSS